MANKDFSDKLKQARLGKGLSQKQVYESLDIKQSRFSAWENGKSEPDIKVFLELCHIYDIKDIYKYFCSPKTSYDEAEYNVKLNLAINMLREISDDEDNLNTVINCLEYEYEQYQNKKVKSYTFGLRQIRVYTQAAAAGLGNYIDDSDYEIRIEPAPPEADFGILISGDSMEPNITDGETVYVKSMSSIEFGEIGIFIHRGNAYCKMLDQIDGRPCLKSVNPKYAPIFITEFDDVRTVGKVLSH